MATMSLAEMFKMKLSEQEREEQQTFAERLKLFKIDVESAIPGIRDNLVKCLREAVDSEGFRKKNATYSKQAGVCLFEKNQWNWRITIERGSEVIVRVMFDIPPEVMGERLSARGVSGDTPWGERAKILHEVIGEGIADLFPVTEWVHRPQFDVLVGEFKVCVLGAVLK